MDPSLKQADKALDRFLSVAELATVRVSHDAQDALAINLAGQTPEQPSPLLFVQARGMLQVEKKLYARLPPIDVLTSRPSTA